MPACPAIKNTDPRPAIASSRPAVSAASSPLPPYERLRRLGGGGHWLRGGALTRRRRRRVERRILLQNRSFEAPQGRARLDAHLLHQALARIPEDRQRLALPPGSVEREHQLPAQALAQRVAGDQRLELTGELGPAQVQVRVDSILERRQPKLVQASDLGLRESLEREVGERRPTPQLQRLSKRLGRQRGSAGRQRAAAVFAQVLEPPQVDRLPRNAQHVARGLRHQQLIAVIDPAGIQGLPQTRDVDLNELRRARGRAGTPELIDEPIARDDLIGIQEKEGKQRALLRSPQLHRPALVPDLKRTEQPEIELAFVQRGTSLRDPSRGSGAFGQSRAAAAEASASSLVPRHSFSSRRSLAIGH